MGAVMCGGYMVTLFQNFSDVVKIKTLIFQNTIGLIERYW